MLRSLPRITRTTPSSTPPPAPPSAAWSYTGLATLGVALGSSFLFSHALSQSEKEPEEVVAELNKLYASTERGDKEEALRVLAAAVGGEEGQNGFEGVDTEVLIAGARANKNMSDFVEGKEKIPYLETALAYAEQVRERDPTRWEAHYWHGIALSLLGDFKSTSEAIANAYVIKDSFDAALELNPNPNGTNYHVLGMWAWTFADMGWVTRKVASALFGSPPTSTYQEALDYFLKAEEAEPGFYVKNHLQIAKCLLALGRKDEAKEWLVKANSVVLSTPKDHTLLAEANALLASL